jgi:hypothetical protein
MTEYEMYMAEHKEVIIKLPMRAWQIVIQLMNDGKGMHDHYEDRDLLEEVDKIRDIISTFVDCAQKEFGIKP